MQRALHARVLIYLLPTFYQGNIASWLKKVGDRISPGDAIAELETDKVMRLWPCAVRGHLIHFVFVAPALMCLALCLLMRRISGYSRL